MKLAFFHDHFFSERDGEFFSDKFPYVVWERYLAHFSELAVVSRSRTEPKPNPALPRSSGAGVTFVPMPNLSSTRGMLVDRWKIKKAVTSKIADADAVIVRLPSEYGLMAFSIASRLRKPCLVEVVGCAWDALWNYGTATGKIYAPILLARMRRAVRSASFVSYVTQEFLQERYPQSQKAHSAAVSNVVLPDFDQSVLRRRLVRLGVKGEIYSVGLIGSFKTRYKGVHTAISALAQLNNIDKIHLHILGDGVIEPYLRQAQSMGVGERVHFDGTLPSGSAVFEWLDNCDLYIQPSFQEGVPRALIEAMSRGCPAVASTAGGIPELLNKEDLFAPGDAIGLAKLINAAVVNGEWQVESANRNFERAKAYQSRLVEGRRYALLQKFAEAAYLQRSRSVAGASGPEA